MPQRCDVVVVEVVVAVGPLESSRVQSCWWFRVKSWAITTTQQQQQQQQTLPTILVTCCCISLKSLSILLPSSFSSSLTLSLFSFAFKCWSNFVTEALSAGKKTREDNALYCLSLNRILSIYRYVCETDADSWGRKKEREGERVQ